MLLIGNLNFFVYFGINEGIQILTIVILGSVTVVFGVFLAIIPWEFIGGPYCSAEEEIYCSRGRKIKIRGSSQSCYLGLFNRLKWLELFTVLFFLYRPRLLKNRFSESMKKPFKDCLFDTNWNGVLPRRTFMWFTLWFKSCLWFSIKTNFLE